MSRFLVFAAFFTIIYAAKVFQPWHCLERCGDDVPALMKQVEQNRDLFSVISFELFNLGPNSTLIRDSEGDLSDPSDFYDKVSLPALPMISSYPP
ncbi:hypothetical protein GEMRC1_006803 [Eukaryota sp. GEM-RC1]